MMGPCGQAGCSSFVAQTGVSRPHLSKFSLHLRWRRSRGGNGLASTCLQEGAERGGREGKADLFRLTVWLSHTSLEFTSMKGGRTRPPLFRCLNL